ncbi:MAG: hypothetical protein Q4P24_16350 [Rhodobacterales bacterium]|nr:hypothetical protein [Rhodobacterales bacterium]
MSDSRLGGMLDNPEPPVSRATLDAALDLFREIVAVNEGGGRQFVSIRQGVLEREEGYMSTTETKPATWRRKTRPEA